MVMGGPGPIPAEAETPRCEGAARKEQEHQRRNDKHDRAEMPGIAAANLDQQADRLIQRCSSPERSGDKPDLSAAGRQSKVDTIPAPPGAAKPPAAKSPAAGPGGDRAPAPAAHRRWKPRAMWAPLLMTAAAVALGLTAWKLYPNTPQQPAPSFASLTVTTSTPWQASSTLSPGSHRLSPRHRCRWLPTANHTQANSQPVWICCYPSEPTSRSVPIRLHRSSARSYQLV